MNEKEKNTHRRKVWHKYRIPGQGPLMRRKINAVFLNPTNSLEHEMAKCIQCYFIQKQKKKFITEAEIHIEGKIYRRDIVVLDYPSEIIEIETDPKRAERFKSDPQRDNIIILKLWEGKNDRIKKL